MVGSVSEVSKGLLCSSFGFGGNVYFFSVRFSSFFCSGFFYLLGCRVLINSFFFFM